MKAALLFDNFGPYHCARLRAANLRIETVGVEFSRTSTDYPWERAGAEGLTIRSLNHPKSSSAFAGELRETLQDIDPAAVAIPGWSDRAALLAAQWCLDHGRRIILMSESCRADAPRSALGEFPKKAVVALCHAALAGGRRHKDYLQELGMAEASVFLGYDAIDNAYFSLGSHSLAVTAESHFLASARFIPKKNLPSLLRAFRLFRERRQRAGKSLWNLVLLGDGPLRNELALLIKELRLEEAVTMPGFKQYSELPSFYARASAFIHASTVEQWGLVVNEAMASGLPVLVSNRCGCALDLVMEGVNGHTFDPSNLEEMAEAMEKIAGLDPSALKAMGEAGRGIISQWGTDRFASGLEGAVLHASRKARPSSGQLLFLTALAAARRFF
jgi:1,2-diacylglycerol 3-alpha-glucosyltransferase